MSPDDSLIANWIERRDINAFEAIVARYSNMVYATCLRILRDPHDAREATQDCFVKLVTREAPIRVSLGGWLHTVATSRALDHVRSNRRRLVRETHYAEVQPDAVEAEFSDDLQAHVDQAIARLPDDIQDYVVAYYLQGLTYEEIAEQRNQPRSTVAYRVQRGVKLLRETLRQRGLSASSAILSTLFAATADAASVPSDLSAELKRLTMKTPHLQSMPVRASAPVRRGRMLVVCGACIVLFAVFLGWWMAPQTKRSS